MVRTLVAFKRKYPSRVMLLIGNRDANKMRLTSELASKQARGIGWDRIGADRIRFDVMIGGGV